MALTNIKDWRITQSYGVWMAVNRKTGAKVTAKTKEELLKKIGA